MFYKKKGLPEEGEYLLCTVKKILYHSVFASIDEYDRKDGMIHISEVSPGRIRNLRDYVKEGKKIICKVLRVNHQRGHVDLSLRRVSVAMRKKKNTEIKQEQKAEKIMEIFSKKKDIPMQKLYEDFGNKLWAEYGGLYAFFQETIVNKNILDEFVPETYREDLAKLIKDKIKPQTIEINRILELKSEASDGVNIIKDSLNKAMALAKKKKYDLSISYISAPRYSIKISSSDYKTAEKAMEEIASTIIKDIQSKKGYGEIRK